jgi:hypothetical protein
MSSPVYSRIEWPESQKYFERKDCFRVLDDSQTVFVPIVYGEELKEDE